MENLERPFYYTLGKMMWKMHFHHSTFSNHFINDIGPLTGFGYFFSHFDDNMKALLNSCSNGREFLERLLNGTLPDHIADEFMNDKESVKELLSGVI